MAQPIAFGPHVFPTKKAATEALQTVLRRYDAFSVVSPEDTQFLLHVFARHPEAAQKFGCGVQRIEVRPTEFNLCFWIVRIDGSSTDISFRSCITPPSKWDDLKKAMREEVHGQIFAFRDANLSVASACPLTGVPLSRENVHVDHHEPSFHDLLLSFINHKGYTPSNLPEVTPTRDGETKNELVSRDLAAEWCAFHRQHARLRLTSAWANLSKGRG